MANIQISSQNVSDPGLPKASPAKAILISRLQHNDSGALTNRRGAPVSGWI
jgi:hypothetical protein